MEIKNDGCNSLKFERHFWDVWRSKQSRFEGRLSETEKFFCLWKNIRKHLARKKSFFCTSNRAYRYKNLCFIFYSLNSTEVVLAMLACFRCGLIIYCHEFHQISSQTWVCLDWSVICFFLYYSVLVCSHLARHGKKYFPHTLQMWIYRFIVWRRRVPVEIIGIIFPMTSLDQWNQQCVFSLSEWIYFSYSEKLIMNM